ncbi:MAG: hypothetical protein HYS98_08950 [Deltaproteobacteria bacterium]|nr:hypothetical protein [Deltaproteobacteria bacterium]
MAEIIVVDNFYKNPMSVRDLALKAEYLKPMEHSPYYYGVESRYFFYNDQIIKIFEELVRSKIVINPEEYAFGRFRSMNVTHKVERQIHFDYSEWSAIVYLSLDDHCHGGTTFFRHKETNLDGAPSESELKKLALKALKSLVKK